MRVAIHQPNFLPWLGFFHKAASADLLVLLDDVQFIKRGFIQRNYVKAPEGKQLLGVPVITKGRFTQTIAETEINADERWQPKMIATLQRHYRKAAAFDARFKQIESVLAQPFDRLMDLNVSLLRCLLPMFGIETPLVFASELPGVTGASTQRLVSICQAVEGTEYLSGAGGKNYQEVELFEEAGLRLAYTEFGHPRYSQLHGDFVENLSAVDYLLNVQHADLFRRNCQAA